MAAQPPSIDADGESNVEQRNADICTVVGAVEQVGSKWKLVILNDLRDGEKRFNELKRSAGASSYTLSRVLDRLEENGFIDNRRELESPVASYYTLTEKGSALCPVFDALDEWGRTGSDRLASNMKPPRRCIYLYGRVGKRLTTTQHYRSSLSETHKISINLW